jgi:hypothetical protein
MKGIRSARTIAAVLLGAALIAALSVGGATAAGLISGKAIKNHSIGVVKLTYAAQKSLRAGKIGPAGPAGPAGAAGQQGAQGPRGPQGPAGRVISAYAHVSADGHVLSDSRNIRQANVKKVGDGAYCLQNLSEYHSAVASVAFGGSAVSALVRPSTVNCSFVIYTVKGGGGNISNAFFVQLA